MVMEAPHDNPRTMASTSGEAAARTTLLQRTAAGMPRSLGPHVTRLDEAIARLPRWLRQFVKFAIVGGTGTVINFAVFSLIIWTGGHAVGGRSLALELLANAVAFCLAVAFNFTLNRAWTFRSKSRTVVRFGRFFLVSLVGLGLNILIYTLLHTYADLGPHITQLLTILFVMPFNFVGSKFWAFR
jgi:dolichol-phosphate mannosyltransferase